MDIALILNVFLTIEAVVAFIFNLYVLVSVILTKQISRPTNFLLLHISGLFTIITLLFIIFSAPSLFSKSNIGGNFLCGFQGFTNFLFHPLALWTVAGAHLDRFYFIAYPLRYQSIITFRKTIIYISMSWILVVVVTLPITFSIPPLSFRIMIGGCWPLFKHNFVFILMYNLIGILIPILIVSSVNMKIVGIAKYHQFRIANALFGITPFGPAELHAAVKERQKDTLRHFEGANAVPTLAKNVGSLCLFYFPLTTLSIYEFATNDSYDTLASKCSLIFLMLSPISNCIIFGFGNKSVQTNFINYARKQIDKSEVNEEIRLRSPSKRGRSPRGSIHGFAVKVKRPSLGNILSQVPYLQQHLSEANLSTAGVGCPRLNSPVARKLHYKERLTSSTNYTRQPRPMTRHISDLSWKVDALKTRSKSRSESIYSAPGANKDMMPCSQSTASLKANSPTNYSLASSPEYSNQTNNILDVPSSDGSESNIVSCTSEKRRYKRKRTSSSEKQSTFESKKGTILQALNEKIFSAEVSPLMKKKYQKNRYPEIKISSVETMDQTSLEFLYPLPPFLVVDNFSARPPNDEAIESDSYSEQSSREISMNEENPLIENVRPYKGDNLRRNELRENENTSDGNSLFTYNDFCDKSNQISIKEKLPSPDRKKITPSPRYDDKHSCKVLIKTVYCE